MTDALISRLSNDLRPSRPGWIAARFALGLSVGAMVSVLFMTAVLGLRPDMPQATFTAMFWVKLGYAAAIGLIALWAVERLARPGADGLGRAAWIAAPCGVVAGLACLQLAKADDSTLLALVMGASAKICPGWIVVCALPFLAGLVWAVRGMAPTRLRAAGGVIGLAAGGLGAAVYALHCPETGAPFLVLWYSLGVAATGLTGCLAGPRLLRW